MIRHLDLFSGIGGFALAVRWLGHETVGFCEIDEWSRRVLDKHWPGVPKHDDIRTLKGTEFGPIDLITGGFPCQPFSTAGKRRGEEDDRHLWPAMLRIIDTARPRFVLGENVAGIVNMALDGVLADLEAIGYTAGAVVIPAGAVNALHRRDRVWILAHRNGADSIPDTDRRHGDRRAEPGNGWPDGLEVPDREVATERMADTGQDGFPRPQHTGKNPEEGIRRIGIRPGIARCSGGMADTGPRGASETMDYTNGVGCTGAPQRHAASRFTGSNDSSNPGARRVASAITTPRAVDAGIDGLSPELVRSRWADGTWELDLPRVVTHEPERKQKLQAAGNAIVPQVAYEILREMIGEAG